MKKTWYKLPSEEITQIYCIPAEIGNDPNNHFWGLTYHSTIELFEGNLPLVVLSYHDANPSMVTLQIHTAHMEVLRDLALDDELNNFNPLEWSEVGGYLLLPRDQLSDICNILKEQKHLIADAGPAVTDQPFFRLLRNDEIQLYRLRPELLPGIHRSYYIQVVQPAMASKQNAISLITISTPSNVNDTVTFEIMTFKKDDLLDESFTPLKHSRAQLYLNWQGLLELIDLLSQAVNQAS